MSAGNRSEYSIGQNDRSLVFLQRSMHLLGQVYVCVCVCVCKCVYPNRLIILEVTLSFFSGRRPGFVSCDTIAMAAPVSLMATNVNGCRF